MGIASVLQRRFSTARVRFLVSLYLADIANQKLSTIYNFKTDFYRNSDECEADQCALTPFPVPVFSFLELSKWRGLGSKTRMF